MTLAAFAAMSQENAEAEVPLVQTHVVEARMDVIGVTVLPLEAAISKGLRVRSRLQGGFKYMYNYQFGLSYNLGMDRRDRREVRRTLKDYEFSAVYHQIDISGYVNPSARFNAGGGVGVMFGKSVESGVVRIGEEYFDPFVLPLDLETKFSGFRIFLDQRFDINDRMGLSFEVSYVDIVNRQKDEELVISTVPSAGPSILTSRRDGAGGGFAIYFSYRLY